MTSPGSSGSPVFLDPSGRRGRQVRVACWALGAVLATYVALVVVSLVAPPGLARLTVPGLGPVLPGPAAGALDDGQGGRRAPERLLPSGSPRSPQASPSPDDAPGRSPSPSTARPVPSASPSTSSAPAAVPSRPPGPPSAGPSTPAASGSPAAAPSTPVASRTPPGQTRRPSPRTGRPSPTASAGPTP